MEHRENRKKTCMRVFGMVLAVFLLLQGVTVRAASSAYWPEGPETQSPNAIVMELSTGTILYEKESMEPHYPASITKILTTLVALENSKLDEIVTFTDDSINKTEGSGIARDYGEKMTMEQCLYGVMLASANECAYAVAEHVGGTVDHFVEMMNQKAKELGCKNSQFVNPHGLHDENHYTSCYDMALIARAAYQNETFRIITGTARYTIPPTNKHAQQTDLQNHNEMLYPFKYNYVYEYCTGGKTGYTESANSTLVTFAEKDGMELVCVVMNTEAPNQWTDSINLFEYCFDNFQLLNIAENEKQNGSSDKIGMEMQGQREAFVDVDPDARIVLPKTAEFSDAVSTVQFEQVTNEVVGTLIYTYADHEVGKADISTTGVTIPEYDFDNRPAQNTAEVTTPETEAVEKENNGKSEKEVFLIDIRPTTVVLFVLAAALLVLIVFFIKKYMDNYYIIRHNRGVRKEEKRVSRKIRKKRRR